MSHKNWHHAVANRGDHAEVTRTFGVADLTEYAQLSGQELHDKCVPEPLIGSLFSYLLGVKLPGIGTMYLKQETQFLHSVKIGEALTARVEITRLRPEKQLVDLSTTCRDSTGRIITTGRALVYVGDTNMNSVHHG